MDMTTDRMTVRAGDPCFGEGAAATMNVMAKDKAKRSGVPLQIYVSKETRLALDQYVASQRLPPTLTDIGELAIQEFLKAEGFYPPKPARKAKE